MGDFKSKKGKWIVKEGRKVWVGSGESLKVYEKKAAHAYEVHKEAVKQARPKEFPCPVCDAGDMYSACEKCLGREADGFKACPYGNGAVSREGQFPCNGCGAFGLLGARDKCKTYGLFYDSKVDCARRGRCP